MAIFKARVQSNYAQIPNSTAQDNRLSFEARGVLTLLLSMPDDWEVTKQWLCNQTSAGRDKIQRIINELVEFGYIRKSQQRTAGGKFTSNDLFVYAESDNALPVDGLAVNGKTHTTKETSLQKKQSTKENVRPDGLTPAKIKEEMNTAFDAFWECWKACKKKMGTYNNSTPKETRVKWDKHFSKSWWNKNTVEAFEEEVNAMLRYADFIHNPDIDFCPAKNMGTATFFKNEGWQGE